MSPVFSLSKHIINTTISNYRNGKKTVLLHLPHSIHTVSCVQAHIHICSQAGMNIAVSEQGSIKPHILIPTFSLDQHRSLLHSPHEKAWVADTLKSVKFKKLSFCHFSANLTA